MYNCADHRYFVFLGSVHIMVNVVTYIKSCTIYDAAKHSRGQFSPGLLYVCSFFSNIYLKLIFSQNWMAFTNLRVDNLTITDSFVFTNTNLPSDQDNYAFCQVRMLTTTFLPSEVDILSGRLAFKK